MSHGTDDYELKMPEEGAPGPSAGGAGPTGTPSGKGAGPGPDRVDVPIREVRGGRLKRGAFLPLLGCNLVVFASSICIMVIELTASRLIAQHLGASLYTWTSVIGVVLAGLSVGNFLGGWMADRFGPSRVLGWQFAVSGLLTFSVLWMNQVAATMVQPASMSWQVWVIVVVSMIFLLPSLALGTISPAVASLALSYSRATGVTVGNVYAWGTMGSILGTFLAGFVLIDQLGSNAIIGTTAAALLVMGALVASGQWAFRALVLTGMLQLVGWVGLFAAADEARLQHVGRGIARLWRSETDEARVESATQWADTGARVGRAMHSLGLALKLRGDSPDVYHDESNYFAISVVDDEEDGELVRKLHLDHLLHSYWSPDNPTKLYYDYERVYAGITERAASEWNRTTRVPLAAVPVDADQFGQQLPTGVTWNPATRQLEARGALDRGEFKRLLNIGPYARYWKAVLELWQRSNSERGEFFAAQLDGLPDGLDLPGAPRDSEDFEPNPQSSKVQYDPVLQSLTASGKVSFEEARAFLARGEFREYAAAVCDLFVQSRRVRTMFIGGGGFVFPRWIEDRFPHDPLIDVAELDPAVKQAVQARMGLPEDDKTHVRTHIGDARKFVHDQRRRNAERVARGELPILYDFVYGDAFNDFSVPWHLTTREFSEHVRGLLDPQEGVYLVNIIDIYPRAEYPPDSEKVGRGEVEYRGPLPDGLLPHERRPQEWNAARRPHAALEIRDEAGGNMFRLRYTGVMDDPERRALQGLVHPLLDVDGQRRAHPFREAIARLHSATNAKRLYQDPLPAALMPALTGSTSWTAAPEPFGTIEVLQRTEGLRVGYRGVMSDERRDQLLALAPGDEAFAQAVGALQRQSRRERAGSFLGRYVQTVCEVFPYVYVFSSNEDEPGDSRDTFVVACSMKPLNLADLGAADGHWRGKAFAAMETRPDGKHDLLQMSAIRELSRGLLLTDDYAPVDNLLAPVFVRQ